MLVNRIAINGINEAIPQTFSLISTLEKIVLIDFLNIFFISSSKFPHRPKSSASFHTYVCIALFGKLVCQPPVGHSSGGEDQRRAMARGLPFVRREWHVLTQLPALG